jgi:Holliday junction resolvase RusA-like endonuclease
MCIQGGKVKYKFTIPRKPVGKERTGSGKYGNRYTPKTTREYEEEVAWFARQVGCYPLKGAIKLTIDWVRDLAGEWAVVEVEEIAPTYDERRRADIDNATKAIADALNNVAYNDDKQITELHVYIHDEPDQ